MARHTSQSLIADLLDLTQAFSSDQTLSEIARAKRDREIGREIGDLQSEPLAQIHAWLEKQRLNVTANASPFTGKRTAQSFGIISPVMMMLGLLSGGLTASAALYYDGSDPVNVVSVLAILVALPTLLLLFWWISALPTSVQRFLPGTNAVAGLLASINPGRIAGLVNKLLPKSGRVPLNFSHGPELAPVGRSITLYFSQLLGVGFVTGALFVALYLVFFTDLAFGWSTTLDVENRQFHALTQSLSIPWQQLFAQAIPSLELVESTRYFRHAGGSLPGAEQTVGSLPALLGQWWMFIILAIAVYAVVPRWLTLIYAATHSRRVLAKAILSRPESQALLERLNQPLVETKAVTDEVHADLSASDLKVSTLALNSKENYAVVNWSSVFPSAQQAGAFLIKQYAIKITAEMEGGGQNTIADDESTIAYLSQSNSIASVLVMVKSWEPPLLELVDFIAALRAALDETTRIYVVPLGINGANLTPQPEEEHLQIWNTTLTTPALGDTRLAVLPA